jgi:hypothetical protein
MLHQFIEERLDFGTAGFGRDGIFLAQLRAHGIDLLRRLDQLPDPRADLGEADMIGLFAAHHDALIAYRCDQPVALLMRHHGAAPIPAA